MILDALLTHTSRMSCISCQAEAGFWQYTSLGFSISWARLCPNPCMFVRLYNHSSFPQQVKRNFLPSRQGNNTNLFPELIFHYIP